MQYHQITDAFRAAMAEAGIITHEAIIADGNLHRFHVEGDKPSTKNGAYILYGDGRPAGFFEHFKTGVRQTWSLSGKREPMSQAMRQQIDAERARRLIETEERQTAAADKAKFIWSRSTPITEQSHPYLIRKRVQSHGLRMTRDGAALVIPIYATDSELINLQFIDADGNKRFLSGGKKKAAFAVIGKHQDGGKVVICEGWATGASLHQHTGEFVIVAMDAGNLEPVAKAIRALSPDAEIIIAGDNDESGKGQAEARKAALAVAGKYIIPPTPGFDWNDEINANSKEAA